MSIATFVYDGDGRQVKSTINGVTTTFVGAHYQIVNGTVTKYYFAGASRIAMKTGSTLTYLLGDHLGSTSLTTDATGTLVSELRYKPWGETRYSSGMTATSYRYTGQREEAGFGLYFYNARWMDPVLGRFAQADTIVPGGVQGLDRYAYVNNSPLVYVDPTGHFTQKAIREYLEGYCNGHSDCVDDMLADWKADKDWWEMITDAQAGDTLFGTSTCCSTNGGIPDDFLFTFAGEGVDTLSGFSNTTTSLEDIQSGYGQIGSPDLEIGYSYKWISFFRKDENGKPIYWHPRDGYKITQGTPEYSGYTTGANVVMFFVGAAACGQTGGWGALICGGISTGATTLIIDALDMEAGDYHVQYGPMYFNFQLKVTPGSSLGIPNNSWLLEKVRR